jgi:MFS family permease
VVLLGLVFEVYEPPSQSTIADVTAAEQRPTAYGLLGASMAAAATGAGLLAALLTSLDLRWLFVVDAATCLTCAAMVFLLLPARPGRREDAPAPPPVTAWRDRRLLALMAAGTVFAVVYLQVTIALPLTLGLRGQPPSAVGLLLALSATTMVLLQPLAHRLRRLDDFAAMTLAYVALAAGLALTGLATSLPTFAAATVVWSLGDLVLLGRAYTVVADIAPETHRGRYLAVYGLCWGVAAVAAPLLGTQLLAHSGPATTWTSLAVLCLALAAAQPALRRRVRA